MVNCSDPDSFQTEIMALRRSLLQRGYPTSAMPHVAYDDVRRRNLFHQLHCRGSGSNVRRENHNDLLIFKCPYSPYVRRMWIPQEFRRLRRELQSLRGSDFLVDTRCMVTHPTSTNCFIESYGLNFVPDDLKRDSVLQEATDDEESSPGGRRGLLTQMMSDG